MYWVKSEILTYQVNANVYLLNYLEECGHKGNVTRSIVDISHVFQHSPYSIKLHHVIILEYLFPSNSILFLQKILFLTLFNSKVVQNNRFTISVPSSTSYVWFLQFKYWQYFLKWNTLNNKKHLSCDFIFSGPKRAFLQSK